MFSRLQSSKIILAFLPPNSKLNFLKELAADLATMEPVEVPPVNDTKDTFSCETSGEPAPIPSP